MKYANKAKLDAISIKQIRATYLKDLKVFIRQIYRNEVQDINRLIKLLFINKPKKYNLWVNRKRNLCLYLIKKSKCLKEQICNFIGTNIEDTYFGNLNFNKIKNKTLKYSTIFGDVFFVGSPTIDCSKLVRVFGDLNFSFSAISSLNVKYVYGNARFFHANISQLNQLCSVGGDLDIRNSNLCSLPSLQIVNGTAFIYNTDVKEIPNLRRCGRLISSYSQLIDNSTTTSK